MNSYAAVFGHDLTVDTDMIRRARDFIRDVSPQLALLINELRLYYRERFEPTIGLVEASDIREAAGELFADYPTAVNVACLVALGFSLRGTDDYEVFVVDELIGMALAETIAGGEPERSFARGNFHVLDITMKDAINKAFGDSDQLQLAVDDTLAGLAAGFEVIVPGWEWMARRGSRPR